MDIDSYIEPEESLEESLYRLYKLKKDKTINCSWDVVADLLNDVYGKSYDKTTYRKKAGRLFANTNTVGKTIYDSELQKDVKDTVRELEKQRISLSAEKSSYRRDLKAESLKDLIVEQFKETIEQYEPAMKSAPEEDEEPGNKAMYALLSDIHYGLSFNSYYGEYNPEIAEERVVKYARKIIEIAKLEKTDKIYVSILGDMISGVIHNTIRYENTKNIIEQIVNVSELTAAFLHKLSEEFKEVNVNFVAGNHSRLDQSLDNALRVEKLDDLIPWYCKTALEKCGNVNIDDNIYDPSIAVFDIFGKTYVAVHGDYDMNRKESSARIQRLIRKNIDYFVMAHMHVFESRFEDVGYIRNGAVVSGGDDYTSKKRLYSPAMQVCMVVSENGVESIHPVKLQ